MNVGQNKKKKCCKIHGHEMVSAKNKRPGDFVRRRSDLGLIKPSPFLTSESRGSYLGQRPVLAGGGMSRENNIQMSQIQRAYTKSGCRSPRSIQALNPPSSPAFSEA